MNIRKGPGRDMCISFELRRVGRDCVASAVLDDQSGFGRFYCSQDCFDRILVSIF